MSDQEKPLWEPTPQSMAVSNLALFVKFVEDRHGLDFGEYGPECYDKLHDWSTDFDGETYEGTMNDCLVDIWDFTGIIGKRGDVVMEKIDKPPYVRFFTDSTVNYAENMLDYWIKNPDEEAIIYRHQDGESVIWTGGKLCEEVSKWEQALRAQGIKKGECVAVNMPYTPDFVAIQMAAAMIGAPLVMGGTELELSALVKRFKQAQPKLLIAPDGFKIKDRDCTHVLAENSGKMKHPPEKRLCIENIQKGLSLLEKTLVLPYANGETANTEDLPNTQDAKALVDSFEPVEPEELVFEPHEFNHPLYYLFTSGTTGKSKGVILTHGGITHRHKMEHLLNMNMGPVMHKTVERIKKIASAAVEKFMKVIKACGAKLLPHTKKYLQSTEVTWMMGPYHYSALGSGTPLLIHGGVFNYPDPDVQLRFADDHNCTHFITSAAQIKKAWIGTRLDLGESLKLQSLEMVGYTGGAMDAPGFHYIHDHINGDVPVYSSSGGTDACIVLLTGNSFTPVYAGKIVRPALATKVECFDPDGNNAKPGEKGELVITAPLVSMPIGLLEDPDGSRYEKEYFPAFENHPGKRIILWGDQIAFFKDGCSIIYGRSGLTHNKYNLRSEPYDIYQALKENMPSELYEQIRKLVSLNLHVGDENQIAMFIAMKDGSTEVPKEIQAAIQEIIAREIGTHAVPDYIVGVEAFPVTPSGKEEVEKLLNKLLDGVEIEDPDLYLATDHEGNEISGESLIQFFFDWGKEKRAEVLAAGAEPEAPHASNG